MCFSFAITYSSKNACFYNEKANIKSIQNWDTENSNHCRRFAESQRGKDVTEDLELDPLIKYMANRILLLKKCWLVSLALRMLRRLRKGQVCFNSQAPQGNALNVFIKLCG